MKAGADEELPSASSSESSSSEAEADENGQTNDVARTDDDDIERFLVIGLSKGTVIFVKVD